MAPRNRSLSYTTISPSTILLFLLLPGALAQMGDNPSSKTFNWYFLIIVVAVLIIVAPLVFYGRRRRAKAIAAQHQGQRALSADVAMFSGPRGGEGRNGNNFRGVRLGMGRWRAGYGARDVQPREEEGLDESGLPPPPYDAGDKPPSINQVSVRRCSEGENLGENGAEVAVPLRTLRRNETSLRNEREFEELNDDVGDLMRPTAAQFGNERRLEEGHSS